MKATQLDRMIGHYCKIVMKEPGDKKAHVVTGTIQEIEHKTRLLMVKSYSGCYCLSIDAIVAIKPKNMNDT
jgi:ribosome maturation factor RimP